MAKLHSGVRAEETSRMRREGRAPIPRKSRWLLLRRSENLVAQPSPATRSHWSRLEVGNPPGVILTGQ